MNSDSGLAPEATSVVPPAADASAPQVPPPPRVITPRARLRSWGEMSVRVWLILTIAIALVTAVFTITRVNEALDDRWLIQNGVDVTAKFTSVDGDAFPKRRFRNQAMAASIAFEWNGQPMESNIFLDAKPNGVAMVGEPFQIKIDPRDPTRWTEQTVPKPWWQELTAVGLLLPVLLGLVAVVLWKRRGVLKTWQQGVLTKGRVVETHHTAAAPKSRVIRFTFADGADRRIFSTLAPASIGVPKKGDTIWLIHRPNQPARAIVAGLYS